MLSLRGFAWHAVFMCVCKAMEPSSVNAFDLLRQPTDPIVTGVVYRATLTNVPDDEPLKGTPYIGQSVRVGKAEAVAEARWKQEVRQAKSTKLEVGFIAALDEFGADAFEWEVLESKTGPRDIVQKWADYREVELIAQHGGTLRDMSPDSWIPQTFNLQKGGKGAVWAGFDAFSARRWKVFQEQLLGYIAEHGTAYVPHAKHNPSKLSTIVGNVRSNGQYLVGRPEEAERRAWLELLPGWQWNGLNAPEYRKSLSAKFAKQNEETNLAALAWNNSTPEEKEKRVASQRSSMKVKRDLKRSKMSLTQLAKYDHKTKVCMTFAEKRKRDMAALRATIAPDARWKDLAKYRKDGSVAKALCVLEGRV
jgi:hypothetical protein